MLGLIARTAYAHTNYAIAKELFYMRKKVRLDVMASDPVEGAIGIPLLNVEMCLLLKWLHNFAYEFVSR